MTIIENFKSIRARIQPARLVAVTKQVSVEELLVLYQAGQRDFGESRVQELLKKSEKLSGYDDIIWHFIGPLQRNKVKKLLAVKGLKYIHSIDSLKLIEELEKSKKHYCGDRLKLFLQVNTSHEEEKHGLRSFEQLKEAAIKIQKDLVPQMEFIGLMTIGGIRRGIFEQEALKSFSLLKQYRDQLASELNLIDLQLSMGMSQDFEFALSLGSNFVRIGRALYDLD
jgi:pyridoxal phosphate enzyme (YggS family)